MSTDNFGALGADFFIKTFDKGSLMSQSDLDQLIQYVQLTTTIMAVGDFTPDQQDSVWMILERVDVPSAPGYTVTNNTDVTMTSGGMVTIDSIPWTSITGKPALFTANQTLNTGDNVSFNRLTITSASGIEGGEIQLAKAPNSSLAGDVIIDVYENKVRFFESGGNGRGFYLDLTTGANNTSTNIMSGGGGTTLPTNASGYLVNDGSGNLSWAAGDGTFSGNYNDLTNKPTIRIAVPTGSGPGGNLQADSLALAGLNPTENIPSTWGGDLILQGGVGGANGDLYGEVRIKSGQIGANYEWHFTTDRKIKLPAGGSIVDSNGTSVMGGSGSYVPAVPTNWASPAPTTIAEALDRMAAKLAYLDNQGYTSGKP